jgi:hypothetical protein
MKKIVANFGAHKDLMLRKVFSFRNCSCFYKRNASFQVSWFLKMFPFVG